MRRMVVSVRLVGSGFPGIGLPTRDMYNYYNVIILACARAGDAGGCAHIDDYFISFFTFFAIFYEKKRVFIFYVTFVTFVT